MNFFPLTFAMLMSIARQHRCVEITEHYLGPPLLSTEQISFQQDRLPDPDKLEIDQETGCLCRRIPGTFLVCFGRSQCWSMPKQIPIEEKNLKITSTHIETIKNGDFRNYSLVENLQIEGNFLLKQIVPGSFENLINLTNLSISFNPSLTVLHNGTFDGLINLKSLFLIKNGFEDVKQISFNLQHATLPKLLKLSLNENNFEEINSFDFEMMVNSSLEELNLVLCNLEHIEPDALKPLKNLKILRLGENNLAPEVISNLIKTSGEKLKLLNLYSSGFRVIPKELLHVISLTNITFLSLARNQFTTIDEFPLMPKLETLDLQEVLALNIKDGAFNKISNLKTLLLSGNKLPVIPTAVLIPSLRNLDLQNNADVAPSYFSITNQIFKEMSDLVYLNLNFNNIYHLFNESFVGLRNLKVLGLKNATIFHIENNTFLPLKKLVFLNLENNDFIRHNAPYGIWPDIFNGLNNLKVLLLGGCYIKKFNLYGKPFMHLTSLKHLGLQNNLIEYLNIDDFETIPNLKSLDLSYNSIKSWDNAIFINNAFLINLKLDHNKITHITKEMYQDFYNLTNLDLTFNSINCDCINYDYYKNLKRNLTFTKTIYCVSSNSSLQDYFKTNDCNNSSNFIVMLPLLFLIVIFICLALLVYYYRWHIKYWMFLTRLYLSKKGKVKNQNQCYNNYVYDAFISYSNEDRNFVVRLVAMLENYPPYLKLCVYERDFEIGQIISECILESVAKSRKTVLIISDSYAKSVWCRWESHLAEHHRLFFENNEGNFVDDGLILVKLGPVTANNLTPTLKFLLKTRIYLQWESDVSKQRIFWDKLRQVLAPNKPK